MSEHELRVALDIGSKKHRVGIATDDGKIIDEFDITHDKAGFELFFKRVEARRNDLPVVVAMEGLNGWARPLDRMILKTDYELLNVNNVKLARFKEIFPGPAKTDKIDTRKTLELIHMRKVLPLAKTVLHRVGHTPVENDQLKRYTRRRRQLVDDKVRVLNRLQSDVQAVSPGLLEITGEAGNLWFLHLLTSREDLSKISGMRRPGLLKIRGVGQVYATKIEAWQGTATFSDEVEWVGPMIIADAQRVLDLTRQVQALEKLIVTTGASSTIARRIETIPGFGPVCSGTLAGEFGNLDRFEAETSLALYSGMTRLDNSSGQFTGSKNTRQVNTHAKAAMMVAVARHIDNVPESRAYYDKKRAEGKTHNQAVRALGRHLIRVIWTMLKNGRDYLSKADQLAKIA
jgi:transposase